MKKLSKILSVGLSLAMCASMVVPSFAASFKDVQDAINGAEGVELENGHTGYGANEDGSYGVEAWDENVIDEDGNSSTNRNVKLNEDVDRDGTENTTLTISKDTTIDLNGNDINGTGKVISVTGTGTDVTLTDTSEGESGSIIGNYNTVRTESKSSNATVTIDGINVSGVYVDGKNNEVTITDSNVGKRNQGEPITIYGSNNTVTMEGDSTAFGNETGVSMKGNGNTFTMNGGRIIAGGKTATDDTHNYGGIGVFDYKNQTVNLNGGTIQSTTGVSDKGNGTTINVNGTNIQGRETGIMLLTNGKVNMTGGTITGGIRTSDGTLYSDAAEADKQDNITITGGTFTATEKGTVKVTENLFPVNGNNEAQEGWLQTADGSVVAAPEGYAYWATYVGLIVYKDNQLYANTTATFQGELMDSAKPANVEQLMKDLQISYSFTVDGTTYEVDNVQWVEKTDSVSTGEHYRFGIAVFAPTTPTGANSEKVTGKTPVTVTFKDKDGNVLECVSTTFSMNSGWDPVEESTVSLGGVPSGTFMLHICSHQHTMATTTKEPTCTDPGEATTTCDSCKKVISTEEIPATGHDYGAWEVVTPATCTEAGVERQVCSHDESHVEEREIPATDHDWDDGVITRQPTETEEGVMTYTCRHDVTHTYTESIPRLVPTPTPGVDIEDPDVPLGEEPDDIEIEDPEVPLAGIFTRADAIGYLWEQTGSPDAELSDFPDVPEDHYWAVAIGWAQDMGIALPDEDGNFRPDDPVLRSSSEPEGELQQFLNRYAVFAGAAEQGETFIQLSGASDDVIMGEEAQVIFDEFFAKLEAALTEKAA